MDTATLEDIPGPFDQSLLSLMNHRRVYVETARQLGDRLLTLQGLQGNPCLKLGLMLLALRHRRSPLVKDQQTPNLQLASLSNLSGGAHITTGTENRLGQIDTLKHTIGNRTHAAKILGISIRTLRNKLNAYVQEGVAVPAPGAGETA